MKSSIINPVRIGIGLLMLLVELFLLLGTDVMKIDVVNYHTGEGAIDLRISDEMNCYRQVFSPKYSKLDKLSFLMEKEGMERNDGCVILQIVDKHESVLYEENRSFEQLENGRFTDVSVGLQLDKRQQYELILKIVPTSLGEYPLLYVCGKEYVLPENKELICGEELSDVQLVSRYCYDGVIPFRKIVTSVLISIITFVGVGIGLPKKKVIRKVVGGILFLSVPYVLGGRLEMLTYFEQFYLPFAKAWNIAIMYIMELIVLLIVHSAGLAAILTNGFLVFVYCANYFVFNYRGTALRINDLSAIGTAADVAGEYSFQPNDHMAMVWALLVAVCVWAAQTIVKSELAFQKKIMIHAVTGVIAVGILLYGGYVTMYTDFFDDHGFADKGFTGISQSLIYQFDGYLVGSFVDIKSSRVKPPYQYSAERVENVLRQEQAGEAMNSTQVSKEDYPHIIMVMNESFADLRVLQTVQLSSENMSFFNSLKEDTIRGYVNASVIGGGTANSEFEALTGCSTAFFPAGYYPYQQGVNREINTLVGHADEYGYTTYSIHPAAKSNWSRGEVYRYLGFEHSYWIEDFADAEHIHHGVSDAETYKKIMDIYENRDLDEKLFIFDVTIQNHGGYNRNEAPYAISAVGMESESVDQYLSLIKISDDALRELITYFEKQDEKVIVCMFGDHHPYFSKNILAEHHQNDSYNLLNAYKTPFIIWANYDIDEVDDYDISMNYLGQLVQETAGIPLSPFFAYLKNLREEYPIITYNGYLDKDGVLYNWGDDGTDFLDYRMMQYNYLFDKNTVTWAY